MSDAFARGFDGSIFEYDGRMGEDEFDDLLVWASDRKASDIRFQVGIPVKAEIGGKIVQVTKRALTLPEVEEAVRYLYGQNGPGEIKAGYDLDVSHEIRTDDGKIRFRVNITGGRAPNSDGLQIVIRTVPDTPLPLSALNVEPEIIENFRPNQGMVLITGVTGSGKSTLMSALIADHIRKEDANESVVEYSKPIEYVYDKVPQPSSVIFQSEVGRHLRPRSKDHAGEESEFAYCVRNALRRKPTIIIIGEARDKATIQGCVEAALTGHVLYSTMHTMGVAETLRRAVMPFPGDERLGMAIDIMETMRMVVTQTLLDRKGGGKVGCREFMVFTSEVRERMLDTPLEEWPQLARKILRNGECVGRSMFDSAKILLEQGDITEDTFRRIGAKHKLGVD